MIPGVGRAHVETSEGGTQWCVFPCQWKNSDGSSPREECRVPIRPMKNGVGASWEWVEGTPADAPTLRPSINCQHDVCWHGYITDGVLS